ncbi:hypothetical protein BJ170DRAFT_153412 [Xylariales sp. AK1849]|nr:hypothetical protein BJ170DRAFT_153412 [Xylariales sp. AK1849]
MPRNIIRSSTSLLDASKLPQDPYYPQTKPTGPSFLDTEACLCALQLTTQAKSTEAAWQCLGNQTQGIYVATTGKWFNSLHGGSNVDLPKEDASNGPDLSKTLVWDAGKEQLIETTDFSNLSVYDQACTAENQTIFTTALYRAADEVANDQTPVDAAPCWRPDGLPVQIQSVSSWESQGCSAGFLCANNTINSLPQYCPPIVECQEMRLSGIICQFEDRNIGMGPFEPVVCQAGSYCPEASHGREILPCPAGTYCQPGAATPTPCAVGSHCPEGSRYELYLIPPVLLIVIDVLMVISVLLYTLRIRIRRTANAHSASVGHKPKGMSAVTAKMAGYNAIDDETDHDNGTDGPERDHEMMPMGATYIPRAETWTGFQAALEMASTQGMRAEELENADGMPPQLRSFVESMRKATEADCFGLSFGYSNLSFQPKGSPRMILQNVTGSIERGSLVAVMGGSGAGKSTFVNVLMGKTNHTGGTVTVNGVPGKIKRYKKLIGYVPQDDIVLPELTVYENILHSARIRLPRTWTTNDIEAHVNSVVDCLELTHVRDSLVGSVGKPVISGGQRKRVSIGMELSAAPMAIFLDEPTSGLDATAASSIMQTLKAIARLGISVIVIIHQPRMEIFEMLDNLILLGNGQIIYEGPEDEVQQFFQGVGFRFPEHSNFGDVVTDIVTGNGRMYKRSGDISKEALIAHWANSRQNSDRNNRPQSMASVNSASMHKILKTRGASTIKQIGLCLRRAMLQQYRTKSAFWFELTLASVAGFLIGLAENSKKGVLFTGLYNEPYEMLSVATDLQSAPELALLVAIAIGLVSGAPGVKVFSEEMLLHRREAEAGHSRLAYFLAKMLSALPRMLFGCLHFSTWLFFLAVPTIPWGTAFLANLVYFYCIYGLSSCLSMVLRREDAPLFATMISLIVGILCGAAPPLSKVKEWHLEWLWRASPGVWLAEIYFGQMVEPFRYLYNVDLAAEVTGYHLNWLWQNMLIMFAIGTIYRIIAYIGLFAGKRLRL